MVSVLVLHRVVEDTRAPWENFLQSPPLKEIRVLEETRLPHPPLPQEEAVLEVLVRL